MILTATSGTEIKLDIRHIIIDGYLQCIIFKNNNIKEIIDNMEKNALIYNNNGTLDSLRILKSEFLSQISLSRLCAVVISNTI